MNILTKPDDRVDEVRFTESHMSVALRDGRTITVPLDWYPRLLNATPEQRTNWRSRGAGHGIHWPELDEDLSVKGLLDGTPAPGWRKTPSSA